MDGKRVISLKRRRPNPLFEDWLTELYDEAKAKKSKLELKLKEALESICKYPLPLGSGADCAILKGFDKKLCIFLDRRIEAYNSQQTEPQSDPEPEEVVLLESKKQSAAKPHTNTKSSLNTSISSTNENESSEQLQSNSDSTGSRNKVSKTRKPYKPAHRSGGYAILVTLLEQLQNDPENPGLKKNELIEKAQQHCDESFTRPKPETFYTAWSNMSRMVTKGLVKQSGPRNVEYSLTDEGTALAIELLENSQNIETINNIIFNNARSTSVSRLETVATLSGSKTSSQSSHDSGISVTEPKRTVSEATKTKVVDLNLHLGEFDVVLLIDKNETSGAKNKNDPTVAQFNKYPDLKHEYRNLKVGDFMWVAQHKLYKYLELVLPYIVERKRMDDLGHSIKDGRFHEQKFRLRKCGIPNVIYLAENFGSNKHVGLPFQSLMQALANTRVHDNFKIHVTNSLGDTARFLAMMTKRVTVEFQDQCLTGSNAESRAEEELMIFQYFQKASVKNKPLTVTETFIKLLLQLKGISVEKALAITQIYKTPRSLITAYEQCDRKEGEMLLANIKYGDSNRNVGPMSSKAIYMFFVWKE